MKKVFEDDSSYIEIVKSKNPGHLMLSMCARDSVHPDHVTMVSVEIHQEELAALIQGAVDVFEDNK